MFLLVYFATGIVIFVALWLLFWKTGFSRRGLLDLWVEPIGALLWPFTTLLSLAEYWHLKSKQRDAVEKAEAMKHANKYSHLTMQELLDAQRTVMNESQRKE